ncbi:substrate-binding domain-containing protein [Arthrobacter sp. LAPM80]|uniref:substrate-binding domain-containing protein n=1 Tax=Arthrobacter sp. LAPM80 TaxID=3141788 RepID=UPI00398B0B42
MQLATYNYQPEREDSFIVFLVEFGVEGLIFVPTLGGIADPQQRVSELTSLTRTQTPIEPAIVAGDERACADLGFATLPLRVLKKDWEAGAAEGLLAQLREAGATAAHCAGVQVPLTAVSPAKHRMGRMAAEILLRCLVEADACPIHQVRLRPRLVVRESCNPDRISPLDHVLSATKSGGDEAGGLRADLAQGL